MKTQVLILLVVGCALVAARAECRVRDYTFDVTGIVSAEDGTALQDVEVILQVDNPIYEGVTPVKMQRIVTSKGAFIFRCLSHSPSTKYTVTVRKNGFEPQTVSGSAPPDKHNVIRLKKQVAQSLALSDSAALNMINIYRINNSSGT
jgi:hypothetical protein